MAELTLRLRVDPVSGKKDIIISYASDEDALPMEHEEAHRALVDQLIEGGAIKASEVGQIVVEREATTAAGEQPPLEEEQQSPEGLKEPG